MSSPEDPTRPVPRVPPAAAPPPLPPRREVVVEEEDPWRFEVLDRLASLRTGLVLVGLLSLIALGLATYTLLTAEEEQDARAGATRSEVRALEERVAELETVAENRASDDAVAGLRRDQRELAERLETLDRRTQENVDPEAVQDSLDTVSDEVAQLDERVQDVEGRVDALEQQSP